MKKIYSVPQTTVNVYQMRWNLMDETAKEVLSKRRQEDEEFEEEEELIEFIVSAENEKPLW